MKAKQNEENRKKNRTSDLLDISNAAQAINSCANAHMCAFEFWELSSVQLLPLNCWCLIADCHCFSPYYRVCHNFVLLGKGFTSTSRLYKIATYQPLWCFMGGDSVESLHRVGGKFRDEPPHVVQVFQTSQRLWRLGPTCVWIPQLKQCI